MISIKSAKPINLKCKEPGYAEFPDLLFGITNDSVYFDATSYLQKKARSLTEADFLKQYEHQIRAIQSTYEMKDSDVCKLNTDGHLLIESSFAHLFISFVEPGYLAHMCARMQELLINGFSLSDTYIARTVRERLSPDTIKRVIDDNGPET